MTAIKKPKADVIVIGAGIIGTSIAWRLSQAGLRVSLVDAGSLGGEASSAAAGMLLVGGESVQPSAWLDLSTEGIRLYPAFVEELRSEVDQPIDFRICGSIQIAVGDEERSIACRQAEFHSSIGIRVELTTKGLFYPEDGSVNPAHLLRALRRACEARNVTIQEHYAVSEIESNAYAALVLAAGAWSSQVRLRHANESVPLPTTLPVKGHLIGFQLEQGILGPMLRRRHTYVLQRFDGFTVAGSTEERAGFDRTVDNATCEDIHKRAALLFPALGGATPVKRWIGFRPYPEMGVSPYIGPVQGTNIWLAYGHYRNGVLLAPLTAQRVANGILAAIGAR